MEYAFFQALLLKSCLISSIILNYLMYFVVEALWESTETTAEALLQWVGQLNFTLTFDPGGVFVVILLLDLF